MKKVISFVCLLFMIVGLVPIQPVMAANAAPKVIPSLREWVGGTGSFTVGSSSRIAVSPAYAADLTDTANIFKQDLLDLTGFSLPVVNTDSPAAGDFYLALGSTDTTLGDEGYLFQAGSTLTIRAKTKTGVFYGTRTALQILLQDAAKTHIPQGTAKDYPKYKVRGFMLDVGRKFFPLSFLKDYVKLMSFYKMNDFQLHLNDNQLGISANDPNWQSKYAAFRLESTTYPGLTAQDGSYSKAEFRNLQDLAKQYALTITPEIDTPGHSLAFTKYNPAIASPVYSKDHLDLSNPQTNTFMNALWDEYIPFFDAADVHIGTDEYPGDAEKFRQYINTYNSYLKSKGKKARMWGSLSGMGGTTPVATDISVNLWNNGWQDPVWSVNQGYDVINTNDSLLYIVPRASYYHDYLDTKQLYRQWEPYIFDLNDTSKNISPTNPHLLGGMFALWNDGVGNGISKFDVHDRVMPAMQTLAEKMWSGTTAGTSYEQFAQLGSVIGEGTGTNIARSVKSVSDTIMYYPFSEGSGTTVSDASGNGYNGTNTGATWTSNGKYGSGIVFSGSTNRISTNLQSKGFSWTAAMWVKMDNASPAESILFESPDGALKLKQIGTGNVGFSREGYDFSFNYTVPADTWVHLALRGDATGTSLFVNGQLTQTINQTFVLPLSTIGSQTSAFRGTLDELRIYNRLLSAGEIAEFASIDAPVNLAVGKPAVASSVETGYFTANKAFDENSGTRWSSDPSDSQWIYVDLGQTFTLNRVKLNWETAYAKSYAIQVSGDAVNWNTVYSTTNGDGGIDDLTFAPVNARYVRMNGSQRATAWGYSLWDFEVYQANLALGKPTTASSVEGGTTYSAARATDGNTTTRWSSSYNDNEWIYVDLGQQTSISKVKLNWESAYGKGYKIQVSNDAASWQDIYTMTGGSGGTDMIRFTPVQARYVKIQGTQRGTAWGYSLWEFGIY